MWAVPYGQCQLSSNVALWSLSQGGSFKDESQGLEEKPEAKKVLFLFLRLPRKASDGARQSAGTQNCTLTQKNEELRCEYFSQGFNFSFTDTQK